MKQLPRAVLQPEHVAYRNAEYPMLSDEHFIEFVCNSTTVLTEHKVEERNEAHLPCCWLGDDEPDDYRQEVRSLAARRRLGWRESDYLVILPSPSSADIGYQRALHRNTQAGHFLREELIHAGINLGACCATYVTRFALPKTLRKYNTRQKKAGLPYLQADIQAVKPKVIIACGADSLKALYGRDAKLDTVRGNILYYTVDGRKIPVIPTVSHLAFLGGHANIQVFRSELRRAQELVNKVYSQKRLTTDYRVCETADQVEQLCREIEQASPPFIAFDTEFGNDVAREEFTYTLSVQVAWGPGKAAYIKLRDQQYLKPPVVDLPEFQNWLYDSKLSGYKRPDIAWRNATLAWDRDPEAEPASYTRYLKYCRAVRDKAFGREGFDYHVRIGEDRWLCGQPMHSKADEHRIWSALQKLFLDRRWRIAAHHLRTDIDQFARNGYPIDERIEDGVDTMLIHHLLYGDEDQGLDHLVRKYVPEFGAYWMDLEEWLTNNCRKKRLRFGYRDIPLDILVPYALADADATWRIVPKVLEELQQSKVLKRLYWKHVAPTSLHLLDVERQGILVDEEQRMRLRDAYQPVYDKLLDRVRKEVNWPDFNPGSSQQMAALLFSDHPYRDKKLYVWSDESVHPLPEGVRGVHLRPLMNTDKYPQSWDKIEEEGEQALHAPATKAAVLDILSHANPDKPVVRWLKHLSVIGKFLSSYLAPQQVNEFGVVEDGKGFHNNIWRDGRVRTHLNQLTSTGRYSSYRANLQTKPKRQEAAAFEALVDFYFGCSVSDYKKRCDPDYEGADCIEVKDQINVPKFATCFIAPPGYILMEADFATAELCVWAYVSGCPDLTKVVKAGRDMHSEVCVKSFNLPEGGEPLQAALEALEAGDSEPYNEWSETIKSKYGALRIAAKTVNFGVMYGRGANALATEINKVVENPITAEEAQKIIDGVAKSFPVAWQWLLDNSEHAVEAEWVANAFGRRRYFQGVSQASERDKAAARREAKNSPIQGCIGVDELVYTFGGVRRMIDLASTQDRLSHGTTPRRAVYAPKGQKDTVTLVLGNGASIRCTPDHELEVLTPAGRQWCRADELDEGSLVIWEAPVTEDEDPIVSFSAEHAGSNQRFNRRLETTVDPDFGYLLGFTVGYGSISGVRNDVRYVAASTDSGCLNPIRRVLSRLKLHVYKSVTAGKVCIGTTSAAFKGLLLEGCGIHYRRHAETGLPTVVFNCSRRSQLAALDGYLTADGTVNPRDGSLTWVTKSERLCRDVANLVAMLGYRSNWFQDGRGYYRGSIPRGAARRLCQEYKLFRHHARKARVLERHTLRGTGREATSKMRVPNWYARRSLPETPPDRRYHPSAYALYNRVQRGLPLSLSAVERYRELGWSAAEPVIPVARRYASGVSEVADLSVVTTNEEDRWFYAGGFKAHNCVADLLAKAGYLLYRFLNRTEAGRKLDIRVLLPIHDAFLFQVRISDIPQAVKLADMCLSALNQIPDTGESLGVDVELFRHSWGDKAADPHKPGQLKKFMEQVSEAA